MHNVTHTIEGDKLIITVDISARAIASAPPSSSGKTILVGTTGGAVSFAAGKASLSYAVNVMAKRA